MHRNALLAALILCLWTLPALAQRPVITGEACGGDLGGTMPNCTVVSIQAGTAFPGAPSTNDVFIVLDDSAIGACDSGAGSAVTFCYWDGDSWEPIGGTGSGGGGGGFDTITTGENTSATMTVGTGASIVLNGSGNVQANQVLTGTSPASGSSDTIKIDTNGDGSNITDPVWTWFNGSAYIMCGTLAYPDTDNMVLTFDSATNSCIWEVPGASAVSLDNAFDIDKEIDGANSEANAVREGDGTDYLEKWCASGTCHIKGAGTITDVSTSAGLRAIVNTVSANYVIGTDDEFEPYGGVISVDTTGVTITLPAIADGMSFTVKTRGASQVFIDPNGTEQIRLNGVLLAAGNKIENTSTIGDTAVCEADETLDWDCLALSLDGDPWTNGG